MDNLQFWLYVIIGIIYLVSRLRKKPQPENEVPADTTQPRAEGNPRTDRQPTFEELLREIMEGKQPEAEPEHQREPVAQSTRYTNYDEEVEDEESSTEVLEDVNYDYRKRDSLYAQYEGAKSEAFNRKSLEETMDVNATDVTWGKFKGFEQPQESTLPQYLSDLKDPEGLRKAFVLSEILKRKF